MAPKYQPQHNMGAQDDDRFYYWNEIVDAMGEVEARRKLEWHVEETVGRGR